MMINSISTIIKIYSLYIFRFKLNTVVSMLPLSSVMVQCKVN